MSPPGSVNVFVSYRRDDRAGHAGRIGDALSARFGRSQVFFDTSAIRSGTDFEVAIRQAIDRATIVIVVIGPDWSPGALARLRQRRDWVEFEIAYARQAGKPILPVLVADAEMPRRFHPSLEFLQTVHAFPIRDDRWDSDIEDLLAGLPDVQPLQGTAFVAEPDTRRLMTLPVVIVLVAATLVGGWALMKVIAAWRQPDTGPRQQESGPKDPSAPERSDPPKTTSDTGRASAPNRPPTTGSIEVDQFNGVGLVSATNFTLKAKGITDPDRDALQYRWDFGDGTPSPPSSAEVTKVFDRVNRFTVRLFVTDGRSSEVLAAQTHIIVRDLTGAWLLTLKPDPNARYVVPTQYEVSLVQQGNQLSGRITPAGSGRPTVLSGSVDHPVRVYFGSESAWWNDLSDAYFDLEVTDGFLMIQMRNRNPKGCATQVPCLGAFMQKQ